MKKAVLYLRVSTKEQNTKLQEEKLVETAARMGWNVVSVYEDAGVSGMKGRDKRPQLKALMESATRREFDVVMAWSIDRLGRSLVDLIGTLDQLRACNVDVYFEQQAIDTTTPTGRLLFQFIGAFAEWERLMLTERVNAGIAHARKHGTKSGKPMGNTPLPIETVREVEEYLYTHSISQAMAKFKLGHTTVGLIRAGKHMNSAPRS